PPAVVIAPPPIVVVVPERSQRLQGVLDGLPQVPPPDELDLLRRANPAPAPALPPEPIPKKVLAGPPLRPVAALNKDEEAKRLLESGREALGEGEPGRAVEQFRRATVLRPDDATGHFLLGQALYAVGRFREAVVAILEGLRRKPDWPSAPFDVRELYG